MLEDMLKKNVLTKRHINS